MCNFYVWTFFVPFHSCVFRFFFPASLHLIVFTIESAACCLLLPFLDIEFIIITIFRWNNCLTRLSSLLATMDANRLSPASSEIRNKYSGALT